MGYALAEVAKELGANVTLVSGPVQLDTTSGIELIEVTTSEEMFEAVTTRFQNQDIVIKSAAVADYRPKHVSKQKLKNKMDHLF